MFVSVLLPTRGRTESVKSSIQSLLETAIEPENIEILFRLDDDDDTDPEELQSLHTHVKIITGPRLNGYQSLDIFYINVNKFLFSGFQRIQIQVPIFQKSGRGRAETE